MHWDRPHRGFTNFKFDSIALENYSYNTSALMVWWHNRAMTFMGAFGWVTIHEVQGCAREGGKIMGVCTVSCHPVTFHPPCKLLKIYTFKIIEMKMTNFQLYTVSGKSSHQNISSQRINCCISLTTKQTPTEPDPSQDPTKSHLTKIFHLKGLIDVCMYM